MSAAQENDERRKALLQPVWSWARSLHDAASERSSRRIIREACAFYAVRFGTAGLMAVLEDVRRDLAASKVAS